MKRLVIGFTGTQQGMNRRQQQTLRHHLLRWRKNYDELEIHHGDCIGADAEFHAMALAMWPADLFFPVGHPPDNPRKRAFTDAALMMWREPKPYLVRNHDIVDEVTGMLVCPGEMQEQLRSGTWATFRYAKKQGKPRIMLWPEMPEPPK